MTDVAKVDANVVPTNKKHRSDMLSPTRKIHTDSKLVEDDLEIEKVRVVNI